VDAFTSCAFKGNAAAIVLLPPFSSFPPDHVCQSLATEFNLSETAFCFRRSDGPGYALRWFTPVAEVSLCGHATLACAHALRQQQSALLPLSFHTRSGEITVGWAPGREESVFAMDFPATPAVAAVPAAQTFLLATLKPALGGVSPSWVGRAEATNDLLVLLDTEADVLAAVPNSAELAGLGGRGVVITAVADPGRDYDFVSRAFFPGLGIAEDPVTGSAHTALAPFWAERLGRASLVGWQASKRGGIVTCQLSTDGQRVLLCGHAVTVVSGTVEIPLL
jgi:PhzF family phenazine biosynthesis protein